MAAGGGLEKASPREGEPARPRGPWWSLSGGLSCLGVVLRPQGRTASARSGEVLRTFPSCGHQGAPGRDGGPPVARATAAPGPAAADSLPSVTGCEPAPRPRTDPNNVLRTYT